MGEVVVVRGELTWTAGGVRGRCYMPPACRPLPSWAPRCGRSDTALAVQPGSLTGVGRRGIRPQGQGHTGPGVAGHPAPGTSSRQSAPRLARGQCRGLRVSPGYESDPARRAGATRSGPWRLGWVAPHRRVLQLRRESSKKSAIAPPPEGGPPGASDTSDPSLWTIQGRGLPYAGTVGRRHGRSRRPASRDRCPRGPAPWWASFGSAAASIWQATTSAASAANHGGGLADGGRGAGGAVGAGVRR